MTRQAISIGTTANDGTGDTLRAAGTKINDNFSELYTLLGGNANTLTSQITLGTDGIIFEGSTSDGFETTLKVTDPTGDRTITFPDSDGNVILDVATQTMTNKTITVKDIIYDVTNITSGVTIDTANAYIKCTGGPYTLTWNEPATTTGELKIFTNNANGAVEVQGSSVNTFTMAANQTKMCIADGSNWIQLT